MMKTILYILAYCLIGTLSAAAQVEFKASAPPAVAMGQQFRLSYTVTSKGSGNTDAKDLRLTSDITDFDVLMGPSVSRNTSVMYVNGQNTTEASVVFTYILQPKKEGKFTLPAATVTASNANYTSNDVAIEVLPADKASQTQGESGVETAAVGKDDIFMTMQVSKRNVYEQEGFLVTFKLYTLISVENVMPKFPEFEGFLVQDIELPSPAQWKLENYNGRNYQAVVIKQTVLYPQRSGSITIPAAKIDAELRIRTQQRVRSIFDMFDDAFRTVQKTISASPVTIEVKPLPAGRPASYANAVGDYKMTASLSSDNVKANEAVTMKINISGTGNMRVIKNPEVKFPNDFDVYDPKVENNTKTTAAGVSGTKTIEYVAIPRYGGDFEIPAVEFAYFDTKTGAYKTLSQGPFKLHVEQGAEQSGGNAPVVSNFTNRESVKNIGQDIRYLKLKNIAFIPAGDTFYGSMTYYLLYIVPALLFIIFFIVYRKQIRQNANIALMKTKKANKIAVRRLKNAGRLMKEGRREEFYDEVLKALWGYLSDKLTIPVASLTKDNVEAELIRYGVGEELIREFMEILNTCEFARYAPSTESGEMDKLYDATVAAIGEMEDTIRK